MSYSLTGLVAIAVIFIINRDLMWKKSRYPAVTEYRMFLFGVVIFFSLDVLWGFIDMLHWREVLFVETTAFFVAMSANIYLWARYVTAYLEKEKSRLGRIMRYASGSFFVMVVIILIINFFVPLFFTIEADGSYRTYPVRHIILGVQLALYLATALYTLMESAHAEKRVRIRYIGIGAYGFAMAFMSLIQVFFPLLPLYTSGFVIGICLIHSFVVEDEKEEQHLLLEQTLERERQQSEELGTTRRLVYTDALTGVKSKQAYVEAENELNDRIQSGMKKEFGICIFDVNELKHINDTYGHDMGDLYIKNACRLICRYFQHSPVFRIGGDEFAVLLEGEDYRNRDRIFTAFEHCIDENTKKGMVKVASGIAVYNPRTDKSCHMVFARADRNMYERKKRMKSAKVF